MHFIGKINLLTPLCPNVINHPPIKGRISPICWLKHEKGSHIRPGQLGRVEQNMRVESHLIEPKRQIAATEVHDDVRFGQVVSVHRVGLVLAASALNVGYTVMPLAVICLVGTELATLNYTDGQCFVAVPSEEVACCPARS
jgi:hypothetical protein